MLIAMNRLSRWLKACGPAGAVGCGDAAGAANGANASSAAIAGPGPAALLRESFMEDHASRRRRSLSKIQSKNGIALQNNASVGVPNGTRIKQ
jgi:hypothetical protein